MLTRLPTGSGSPPDLNVRGSGRRRPDVREAMPVADTIRDALLGTDNDARRALQCTVAHESGDWDRCLELAGLAGANASILPGRPRASADLQH